MSDEPLYGAPGHPKYAFKELSPGGPHYPKWIPCVACRKSLEYHIGKTCPFDSTEFSPDENTIELILGELRMADRKRQEEEEAAHGSKPRNVTTRDYAETRYLEAYEVVKDTLSGRIRNE